MVENVLQLIQGSIVKLQRVDISASEGKVKLQMNMVANSMSFELTFFNVSRISMDKLSWPMVIEGIEIICNTNNGWDNSSRYMVHDYENNAFSFFCEDMEANRFCKCDRFNE